MKKLLILALFAPVIFSCFSCGKAKELTYNAADNIYFDFDDATNDRDSIVYTFAYEPGKAKDTIFLPVRISGNRTGKDRFFKIGVNDGSTAVADIHYERLKEVYTIPADSGTYNLPIVLLNSDPALSEKSVTLKLSLISTDDFGLNINGLTTAKVTFSSKLEKPEWWDMWLGNYYSQVKHELFLISSGTIHMSTSGLDAPKNLYHVGRLNSFLNDPFGWVRDNPESDYVLMPHQDSAVYDFYNTHNPERKIELRKNMDSGKYFFIDENGQEVI